MLTNRYRPIDRRRTERTYKLEFLDALQSVRLGNERGTNKAHNSNRAYRANSAPKRTTPQRILTLQQR